MSLSAMGKRIGRRVAVVTMGIGAAALLAVPAAAGGRTSPLAATEKANIRTIDSFIGAWNAKDGAKVMSFFADDARFAVGDIGKTPPYQKPDFAGLIQGASSIRMTITPGTTWARGPVVTHERVDEIILGPNRKIAGKYIAVFTLRNGKIVDFTDYVLRNDSSPEFR